MGTQCSGMNVKYTFDTCGSRIWPFMAQIGVSIWLWSQTGFQRSQHFELKDSFWVWFGAGCLGLVFCFVLFCFLFFCGFLGFGLEWGFFICFFFVCLFACFWFFWLVSWLVGLGFFFPHKDSFVLRFRKDVVIENRYQRISCSQAWQNCLCIPSSETGDRKQREKYVKRGREGKKGKKDNSAPLDQVADL